MRQVVIQIYFRRVQEYGEYPPESGTKIRHLFTVGAPPPVGGWAVGFGRTPLAPYPASLGLANCRIFFVTLFLGITFLDFYFFLGSPGPSTCENAKRCHLLV